MDFYSEFVEYYDFIFPVKSATVKFLEGLISDYESHVLDLGCGTAELLNRIATNPSKKTGIDIDENMIREAREKFPAASFHSMNITNLNQLNFSFDLIYSTGNVLSYLNAAELLILAKKIKDSLNKNGKFAAQVVNWDKFNGEYDFSFPSITNDEKQLEFRREYKSVSNSNEVEFHTALYKSGEMRFSGESILHPTLSSEHEDIFKKAGFTSVEIYGDFTKSVYKEKSPAIILVCQ
ncbi:MAG: methyltransferase [Melioribacteraceae bacterium]|nr:MAG: methyltransferase [Melioribacteraceae bacterium]